MMYESRLSNIPFFAELVPNELDALTTSLRRRRFGHGEAIFHRDDPGNSLYVIVSGTVKITLTSDEGKEVILAFLGPDEFFGELALLDGQPRSADAVAVEASELLLLHRDGFNHFLETHPKIAIQLLATLSRELRNTTHFIYDSAFLDVPGRLARALLKLSTSTTESAPIRLSNITQAELGGLIGATRESINKWLGHYQKLGFVKREHGGLVVLKPNELRRQIY